MVLEGIVGTYGYQLELCDPEGHDEVAIRIEVPNAEEFESHASTIMHRFKHACDVEPQVTFVRSLRQAVNEGGFTTWKTARIIDRRTKRNDTEETT